MGVRGLVLFGAWLLIGIPSVAFAADPPVVAVLDLDNRTGDPSFDAAGPGVAQILVSKFARVDDVRVVERERISAVLGELKLQRGREIDDKTAVTMGKLLGAQYLVMGQLFSVKLPSVVVSLRIVDAATGQVIVAKDVTGEVGADGTEFFVLIDEVAFEVLDALHVKLGASERIEFGQIDVRRLDTLEAYGKALKALDAGRSDDAQRLLGEAIALEPGFRIAEEQLDAIAASIAAKRTSYAHAAITDAHTAWDRLRAEADPISKDPPTTLEGAAWMALRGRLYLIDGQIAEAVAFEERRAQWHRDHWDAITGGKPYMESQFDATIREILTARDMQAHNYNPFGRMTFYPSAIRADIAQLLVILGRKDEAAAQLITMYQDPGPLERPESRPPDVLSYTDDLGLWDLEVVLREQQIRLLELEGDVKEARSDLSALEHAVYEAKSQRELRKKYELVQARIARETPDWKLLGEEDVAVRAARADPSLALTGYQAFAARVRDGYYDAVKTDDRFEDLAEAWHDTVRSVLWSDDWAADQRVAALLAFNEQVPTSDPEQIERRKTELDREITGWYPK